MRKLVSVVALLIAALSVGVIAAPVTAQDDTQLEVVEYTLDNGLEVILVMDDSAPTVAVDVWYHVGAADDPDGRSGFAHLFEHMMFQGSENIPRSQHFQIVSAAGGSSNATTGRDRTNYFAQLPAHQLPVALFLEADRMASLRVNEGNFNREREVVKEEYRLRYENAPYGQAFLQVQTVPHEDYAPYQNAPIGSVEDLDASTIEDVRNFHNIYYVPNNATLVVAGDIDVDVTRDLIDDYFSDIPEGEEPPALPDYEWQTQDEAEEFVIEDPLAQVPAKFIVYPIRTRDHPDYLPLSLLASVLGSGDSSRLAQSLIDTGIATSASAFASAGLGPGQFRATLVPNPGVDIAEVEQVFYDELQLILDDGITDAEFEKIINGARTGEILSLQSALGLAESVQSSDFYLGSPTAFLDELDRYADVTVEDIQRVIDTYLTPENRHIFDVVPVEGEAPAAPGTASDPVTDEVDMEEEIVPAVLPEPLPVREFNLPEIEEVTLDNGLRVMVIPQDDLPIVAAELIMPGGASAVSEDKTGLADYTASLLTRGTEDRTAQDIAAAIEQVGGSLEAGATRDVLSVSTIVLSENAELAFDLMGDVVLNPTFPEDELENLRQRSLRGLEFDLADPGEVASRAFRALVYGDHPYGYLVTEETYTGITQQDIMDYYSSQAIPENALLVVVGDVTVETATTFAEDTFGEWESNDNAITSADLPELTFPEETTIYLVDRPGSTQVEILMGHPGISGSDPTRRVLQVANRVLGGSSSARLFVNLREQRGYTYGVYSGFSFPRDPGSFSINAAVRPEVIQPALEEIFDEVERMRTEPVPLEELENVKSNIIGSYALSLETALDLVGQVASLEARGLTIAELETYLAAIEAVDQDAVLEASQAYFQPGEMVVVVVGDAEQIQADLEAIAPLVLIDASGEIITD